MVNVKPIYLPLTVYRLPLMNYFNYFSEIEELFIRRRGRNLLLSPLDWALIETWQERNVPLHVVLSAIERVFDGVEKQPEAAKKRPIKSLTYCREEIETQYAAWLDRQVGKNGTGAVVEDSKSKVQDSSDSTLFSDEAIAAHFEKVAADLKDARRNINGKTGERLDDVLKRLEKLETNSGREENLESALEKLDASLDEALLESEFATNELKLEIKKQIAGYRSKMETETFERTFSLMLLKRLRETAEIPRLSLFYL